MRPREEAAESDNDGEEGTGVKMKNVLKHLIYSTQEILLLERKESVLPRTPLAPLFP